MSEDKFNMNSLSLHDKAVLATRNILSAHGFNVKYTVKGKRTARIRVTGDSGNIYEPDIIAERGLFTLVVDLRTSPQRGARKKRNGSIKDTSRKTDRYAIQFLKAELDDLVVALHGPHGLIVTPYGIKDDARDLANHFGIYVFVIPEEKIKEIVSLDIHSEKDRIIDIAKSCGIAF